MWILQNASIEYLLRYFFVLSAVDKEEKFIYEHSCMYGCAMICVFYEFTDVAVGIFFQLFFCSRFHSIYLFGKSFENQTSVERDLK